jgi:LacI family transcriptional regulator
MAIGLLGGLRDAGVRVPEDMAVAGFDDVAMARYVTPPLTTVHVDAHELGVRSVRLLAGAELTPGSLTGHEVLPAPLVVRSSCGSPAPRNGDGARAAGGNGTRHATPGEIPPARRSEP